MTSCNCIQSSPQLSPSASHTTNYQHSFLTSALQLSTFKLGRFKINQLPYRMLTCISLVSMLTTVLMVIVMLSTLSGVAFGHGVMSFPPVRGTLGKRTPFVPIVINRNAPNDHFAHFPSGVKSRRPGAGKISQMQAAGPHGWTPYKPLLSTFRWRSGVCGDAITSRQAHIKGGEYYFGGHIVATYTQGSYINVEMAISAHHNGFIELHVCDVSKCRSGDISPECFSSGNGACTQLMRAPNPECDSGMSRNCGPIDQANPGRWYLPCSSSPGPNRVERFGQGGTIRYALPGGLVCDHCVLQMYWVSANSCNPPGVVDYFRGRNRPRAWGRCPGQGDAIGGYARNKQTCGYNSHSRSSDLFPEEYLQCADIRIRRYGAGSPKEPPRPDVPNPAPALPSDDNGNEGGDNRPRRGSCGSSYDARGQRSMGSGGVRDLVLVGDGCRVASLMSGSVVRIGQYSHISIEAIVEPGISLVTFVVDGAVVHVERSFPYHIVGSSSDREPLPWSPPLDRRVSIQAIADGDRDSVEVTFIR